MKRWKLKGLLLLILLSALGLSVSTPVSNITAQVTVLINEVDADNVGTDAAEFTELYDGGVGNTSLDGLVLVLFNGSSNLSYQAFDLDGQFTNASGYFVLCGNATNVANCSLDVLPDTNLIQNGADAVALYNDDATNFPSGTALTTINLIDALVYDTNDGDDAELLTLLNANQPQVNEGTINATADSNQRCPNGAGGVRNTTPYIQAAPTPGEANNCPTPTPNLILTKTATPSANVDSGDSVTYVLTLENIGLVDDLAASITDVLPADVAFSGWLNQPNGAVESGGEISWNGTVPALSQTVLSFTVINNAPSGSVTNIAQFNGSANSGSADAVYTVAGSTTSNLIITEIMYNPNSAEDNWEWIEVVNTGAVPLDLTGYVVDDSNNTAHPTANIAGGTLAPNQSAVLFNVDDVSAADFQAAWGIVDLIPVTNWEAMGLNNGGDSLAIWDSLVAYNGDNVTQANAIDQVVYDDVPPWPTDDGLASIYLTNLSSDNNDGANWALSAPGATTPVFNTYIALAQGGNDGADIGSPGTPPPPPVFINETRVSKTGTDADFFEIQGDAGADLSGLTYLVVSGNGTFAGQIDFAFDLSGLNIPTDGFFLAASPETETAYGVTADLSTPFDLFGSTQTHLLVSSFSGTVGTDLDTNDDGTFDEMPWGSVLDAVSLIDGDATDATYADTVIGPDGNFLPAGTFRCPNGPTGTFDNNILSFSNLDGTPGVANSCSTGQLTLIHDIQGAGNAATPGTYTIQAVVTGVFNSSNELGGFYVQEEDAEADADTLTSEGIFIISTQLVNVGDLVEISGTAQEDGSFPSFDQAIMQPTSVTILSSGNLIPAVTIVELPIADVADWERYEGMLVQVQGAAGQGDLTVTEFFNLDRFGEVLLSVGGSLNGRLEQFTSTNLPDVAGNTAHLVDNATRTILVDDGRNGSNNFPILNARGGNNLTPANTLRGGDTVSAVTGIVAFGFSRYRLQPTESINYQPTNVRPVNTPNVGGDLKVVSLNVLNFFNGDGNGGGFPTARGATTFSDSVRQRIKLYQALTELDADIIGLVEIENDGFGPSSAIAEVIKILNEGPCFNSPSECTALGVTDTGLGTGTYAFVDPGIPTVGDDQIAVGFIYKTTVVQESGVAATLDTPANLFQGNATNRVVLAQTFQIIAGANPGNGAELTVAVNHFKSKGASTLDDSGNTCGVDFPIASNLNCDQGDGQGYWNERRTAAANALAAWLLTNPTGNDDPDTLIIGDLNAYKKEDPITALEAAGYTNLISNDYSFVFSGQWGSLDYAMANATLAAQVTGAAKWHINADEPDALDYSTEFNNPSLYAPDFYRVSDHDPLLVGFSLTSSNPQLPPLYLSSSSGGRIDGVSFADEDILALDMGTATWSLIFDGSDVGLARNEVDAFHLLDEGNALPSILLSLTNNQSLPGLGWLPRNDIVKFVPTSLGQSTSGHFVLYLDGSMVGLSVKAERIDALTFAPDGRLVVSTAGSFRVPGTSGNVRGRDEDLIALNANGTWDLYFDGSTVGLTKGVEDVWGTWIDPTTGQIYLTTQNKFVVNGLNGTGGDVFICNPTSLGENNTQCTFSGFFSADAFGFGRETVDGFSVGIGLPLIPAGARLATDIDDEQPLDLEADDVAEDFEDGDPAGEIEEHIYPAFLPWVHR